MKKHSASYKYKVEDDEITVLDVDTGYTNSRRHAYYYIESESLIVQSDPFELEYYLVPSSPSPNNSKGTPSKKR